MIDNFTGNFTGVSNINNELVVQGFSRLSFEVKMPELIYWFDYWNGMYAITCLLICFGIQFYLTIKQLDVKGGEG